MKLAAKHPGCLKELTQWYRAARKAAWLQLSHVRRDFASADQVGTVLIFDVSHNALRLIVRVNYTYRTLYVKALLTHKEYDRKEWMKWAR